MCSRPANKLAYSGRDTDQPNGKQHFNGSRFLAALASVICLCLPSAVHGQSWTSGSGGAIYYNGGNVGIGTTTPGLFGEKLTVAGTNAGEQVGLTILNQSTAAANGKGASVMLLGTDTVGNQKYVAKIAGVADDVNVQQTHLSFHTAYSGSLNERLRIDTLGNIGIGTASPQSKLDFGTSVNNQPQILNIYSNGNARTGIGMDAATGGMRLYAPGAAQNHIAFGSIAFTGAQTWTEYMRVATDSGNVGIRTTNPTYPLTVNGAVRAKEIIVDTGWADYVFEPNYKLASLDNVATYIKVHHHLPNIPSEEEIKRNGASIGEMQAKLLAKIEELTLQLIQEHEQNKHLEQSNRETQQRVEYLEKAIARQ